MLLSLSTQRLMRVLVPLLVEKRIKLLTAESCTGGLLAGVLTALPGSSTWFSAGFVTYTNEAKQSLLAVDPELIQKEDAVSEAVAKAMAEGALAKGLGNCAISTTGFAGPLGGRPDKPVGTVCFAWSGFQPNTTFTLTRYFPSSFSRKKIREVACKEALLGALRLLKQRL